MIHRPNVESDVIDQCMLKCKSCGHVAPFYKKNHYAFDQFKLDVETLAKVFRCDRFTFLGGEPLLLRDKLPEYVDVVRRSGICKTLKINTNGLLAPQYAEHLKLFDFIHISLYPHQHRDKISKWFHDVKQEFYDLGKEFYLVETNQFAESFTDQRLTDERAEESWAKCGARKWCHQLYNGHFYLCGPVAKFHRVLEEKGISVEQRGCNLYEPDLERRLKEYLDTKERLGTCHYCLGHTRWHEWREER